MILPFNMCYPIDNFKPPLARNDVFNWNDDIDAILSSDSDSFLSSVDSDDLFGPEEENDNESLGENPVSSVITFLENDIEEVITVVIIVTVLIIGFVI